MNLLSVAAAYGALTLVFQKGVGIGFFNAVGFQFQRAEAIEAWLPLFLFSVLFGLSMDYQVFLVTRIREEYDRTGDNDEAVAYGLRTTAGIITGAALIMVAVFTGFAAGRLGPLQQMGFRPRCGCSAPGTGICRSGWSGSPRSRWRGESRSARRSSPRGPQFARRQRTSRPGASEA